MGWVWNSISTFWISDNINKVPRDLSEVGPDQEQYRSSSTKLFLRVNNTGNLFDVVRLATGTGYSDATNVPTSGGSGSGLTVNITTTAGGVDTVGIYELGYGYQDGDVITISGGSGTATARLDVQDERNQLYFPGREDHYVAQIGKQQEVLDATGQSDPGNTLLSKYIPYDGYYSSESNPLIAVIELNNTESPGVTYQQWFATRPLLPRLCVYETEPQESVLDIYWETSTNGLLSDLNDLITTTFDGVLTLSGISTNFREGVDYGTTPSAVTDIFYALDSTGGNISNVIIDITQVTDGDGAIIQTDSTPLADRTFTINQNILPSGDELEIFCQKNFTYRDTSSLTDVYTVTMQTTFAGETTTHDRIIPLQNDCPSFIFSGTMSGFNVFNILDTDKDVTPIIALQNGSQPGADPFPENRIVQLNIEIINEQRVSPGPTVDTNIFTLDPITWNAGSLTGDSFLRVNETLTTPGEQYVMTIRATDAAQGFGFCAFEETIAVNIGSSPRFVGGVGAPMESTSSAVDNWSCGVNQPLRTFIPLKGFLQEAGGCILPCNSTTTGNPITGYYSNPFPPFANQIPLAESKISGIYTVQNINTNQTDLQAEVVSSIVNPGTGYVLGTQLNVTGGSGLNMTVNITGVNGAGGVTSVEIANSGTLAPPYGTGPTGYVNGDEVTIIQVGSGNNAVIELDGGITSNTFVVSYEVITPNVVPGGNDYQFSPVGTATKNDFEIVHKYRQNGSPCDNSIPFNSFTPDYSASAGTGDPTKGYLVFGLGNTTVTGSATRSIEHAITNIFKESQKNATTRDIIAAPPAGVCITDVLSKDYPIIQGTIYFRVKLKAFDPTGKIFGSTTNPGTLTGWDYYDNNKVLAEDVLGMVFSDMQNSWSPSAGCKFGINDPRFVNPIGTCGPYNTCL